MLETYYRRFRQLLSDVGAWYGEKILDTEDEEMQDAEK
jgi:hypothetical protein